MLPQLPLENWESTKETLHRYLQIIGKIKMQLSPPKNHWWHITLHAHPRGITTRSIPYKNITFEILIDCVSHELQVVCSSGQKENFELVDGLSVAQFYQNLLNLLDKIGVGVKIKAVPYDLGDTIPFEDDKHHNSYNTEYVGRFWQILLWVDGVFNHFAGRAYCKTSPVNIYWHHMDIAVTRFNGDRGPELPEASMADKEAYSHEVISFGFWAGDNQVREPAFYSYTYPSPEAIEKEPLIPDPAKWVDSNGSPMAFLAYHDLIKLDDPEKVLLEFMQSAYDAVASLAGWQVEEIKRT